MKTTSESYILRVSQTRRRPPWWLALDGKNGRELPSRMMAQSELHYAERLALNFWNLTKVEECSLILNIEDNKFRVQTTVSIVSSP